MKLALRGGKAREKVMVVFRIKSDWLRKWRDIFLTNHESQKIPNNPKSLSTLLWKPIKILLLVLQEI